ncbi:hypothetical protein BH23ACT6_BH23ACT6_05040 [soil metagenome]
MSQFRHSEEEAITRHGTDGVVTAGINSQPAILKHRKL